MRGVPLAARASRHALRPALSWPLARVLRRRGLFALLRQALLRRALLLHALLRQALLRQASRRQALPPFALHPARLLLASFPAPVTR
ncbi:hypothetical protein J8I87_32525 [Paraburkholderia sp. LEh10]|nr:hypothetical protein [Paraburkholderia sp. LEh10]MBP0594308.1 hypothetical protein [Paraburkholderia sp. LEh10]